jgi:hypothetical protein
MLHRAAKSVATDEIQLVCIEDAVLVPTARGHVSLSLVDFGPTSIAPRQPIQPNRHSDLPLFRQATFKDKA